MFRLAAIAIAITSPSLAQAAETMLSLQLGQGADFEQRVVRYECGGETPLLVTYVNATPNFLALVTLPEDTSPSIFASVLSASGARYASGHWVWWSDGTDASLYDITLGDDAEPVLSCSEFINTP